LTLEEQVESLLGAPPDGASLFSSASDRTGALRALAELDAGLSDVALLIRDGAILRELRRRHERHWAGTDDRASPAMFLSVPCPGCNRQGWRPWAPPREPLQ
jgi:hypothetical protein